ncbi:MAG: hypothetical protein IPK24_08820 [Kineosporiaceae bacterium]|nr:hypothetical protein [Kineosporiaceae bacterium]
MTTWGNQRARGTHTAGAGAAAAMLAILASAGLAAVGPSASASAAGTGSPTTSSLRRLATPLTPRGHEVPAKVVRGAVPTAAGKGYSTLGASPVGKAGPVALPTFSNTFTWNGDLYPYRMVGRSPAGSAHTTALANTIVPIAVKASGVTIPTTASTVRAVTSSGLFTSRTFPGGTGQYGDVFMRTQFWSELNGGTKNWHVVMAAPTVKPTITLTVPSGKGTIGTIGGVPVAMVDADWLDTTLLPVVRAAKANVLTQLLTTNVVACAPYTVDLSACGIGGFHSAVTDPNGTHTYTYQSFLNPALFGSASGFTDIGPMSHELAEWLTDPYLDNRVPEWISPLAPQYGCMEDLESGDPVVGKFIRINTLAYQDEAYLAWFARSASTSWQNRYTWFDSFASVSPPCIL